MRYKNNFFLSAKLKPPISPIPEKNSVYIVINRTLLNLNDESLLVFLLLTNLFMFSLFPLFYEQRKKKHFWYLKQVGDRVVALPEFRAWAELCAVPTKYVYKIPDELSFQDAAAMAMNYLVAYIIVYDLLSLRAGNSVVLHSAGGGVVSISVTHIYFSSMSFAECMSGVVPDTAHL